MKKDADPSRDAAPSGSDRSLGMDRGNGAAFLTAHWAVEQALEKLAYPFVSHNAQGGVA